MNKAKRRKHRGFLKLIIVVLITAGFWFFENYTFKVEEAEIKSKKLTDKLTFAVISDLHGSVFGKDNSALINKIDSLDPDLIFVLGDMYSSTDKTEDAKYRAADLMESFAAPVYFVPGEHDYGEGFEEMLTDRGINVMPDRSEKLTIAGNNITIYGIDDVYFPPNFNLESKFGEVDSDSYTILLAHIPHFDLYMPWGADLVLCGDTHGGVMQIPFCGPLYYEGRWLPELTSDREVYDKGLYETGGRYMFVTSGLGNFPAPVRLFNRPEVAVIKVLPR
ncbi:MAG: metallophosphoesterase [Clostridia bacterium]|nr:metallophosphoesterase [Clostridia bacterium]